MKKVAGYKCKQCGSIIYQGDDGTINSLMFDRATKIEGISCFVKIASSFGASVVHNCGNQKVGICELIGWRMEE